MKLVQKSGFLKYQSPAFNSLFMNILRFTLQIENKVFNLQGIFVI
jgi:hypothetical protein